MKAHPSFQFYPSDWLRDPGLRSCSLAARGLWIDMLAFMHEAEPYGHLRLMGQDIRPEMLARMVGASVKVVRRLLTELETVGVFSRTVQGSLYSRRMVKDHALREKRGQFGHLSQNHPLVPRKIGEKDREKDMDKDIGKDTIQPSFEGSPSSSSSSSSSLKNYRERNGSCGETELNGHGRSFDMFWAAYPKHEAKKLCRQWWAKHKPDDVLLGIMLAKIDQAKQAPKWKDRAGKFIPMPLTWLNGERWEDEFQAATRKERLPL